MPKLCGEYEPSAKPLVWFYLQIEWPEGRSHCGREFEQEEVKK